MCARAAKTVITFHSNRVPPQYFLHNSSPTADDLIAHFYNSCHDSCAAGAQKTSSRELFQIYYSFGKYFRCCRSTSPHGVALAARNWTRLECASEQLSFLRLGKFIEETEKTYKQSIRRSWRDALGEVIACP